MISFRAQIRPGGWAIVGNPYQFSFFIGILSVICAFSFFDFKQKKAYIIKLTWKSFAKSLLIGGGLGFLSVTLVDLTNFALIGKMYIGALGLTDGILLSGIYSMLTVALLSLLFFTLFELTKLLKISGKELRKKHFGRRNQSPIQKTLLQN